MTAESLLEVTLFVAGAISETALQLWPAKTRPVSPVPLGFRLRTNTHPASRFVIR